MLIIKNMKRILFILFLCLLPISVFALTPEIPPKLVEKIDVIKNYRSFVSVESININVPTVVELKLEGINTNNNQSFLVYDRSEEKFISSLLINNYSKNQKTFSVVGEGGVLNSINDGDYESSETFMLPIGDQLGSVELIINYDGKIRTDGFNFKLDSYVSLPNFVTISYVDDQNSRNIIASNIKPNNSKINFPEVISDQFIVKFDYIQPLRITEISFDDLDLISSEIPGLRFLAKPNNTYEVYFNRENYVKVNFSESPNLSDNRDIIEISYTTLGQNSLFVESDIDDDGVIDKIDNCVHIANSDQIDINNNGRGDACDDFDKDGVINSQDNCPNDPNRNQSDIDGDDIGDSCDEEESRITEKYPFIVWGGILLAVLVFVLLYFSAIKKIKVQKEEVAENQEDQN